MFFSVIIPTFNRSSLLKRAVQSVINQSFTNWECIIIDDGSIDDTSEVVKSINDARVKYFYQQNAERSAARNNGISKASGQFICFLDSDDYYLPNHLSVLFDEITKSGNQMAMFVTDIIRNENGTEIFIEHEPLKKHSNMVCYFLMATESVIPARVAIHREILYKYKFDTNFKDVEDIILWIQIATAYPVFLIPVPTAVYYLHENNSTNEKNNPFKNQLKGLKRLFSDKSIRKWLPYHIRMKKLSYCYFGMARHYLLISQSGKARWFLIKSLFSNPFSNQTKLKLVLLFKKTI
jgi:glycosyltransferase involved in cell wall biosynthesis